jgi:glycogen debranching enzyme
MKTLEYRYPTDALFTGCSLGNMSAFARLSASTDLLGLWNASDNQHYAGAWTVQISSDGVPFAPVETRFAAIEQSTTFSLASIDVRKSFILPLAPEGFPDPTGERIALFLVEVTNKGQHAARLNIRHRLIFPAVRTDRFTKQPPEDQCSKTVRVQEQNPLCTILTIGRPDEARVFGGPIPWSSFSADATTLEADYDVEFPGGESRELWFVLAFSPHGITEARKGFQRASTDQAGARSRADASMNGVLSRSHVFTPDPLINRAMQWAKVNMIRVRHAFRAGESFTNDPPQDIVVVRDLGWFVLGADYILPGSSRNMLECALRFAVHDEGKLTEYFHADEIHPVQHDYRLNINDDTPLFLWGLLHHATVTGDREFLTRHWGAIEKACQWMLSQVRDGLVRCTADGTNVWGICSWRNIIDDYALTGAVTEINSECSLALNLAADAANVLGRADDGLRWKSAADALRGEINRRLVSAENGMYVLNIDREGKAHHDVTGDLIFPVLAGITDEKMSGKILKRLLEPDIWTPFGMRTVAPAEPNYDPDASYQLLGGVWPNLTAWTAFCLRALKPERVAEAMTRIYRIAEKSRPRDWGFVVPGQFPERLHGTDFRSRGMTLSPWTPPTYLWLAVEGLLGVHASWTTIEINPAIPQGWGWIAVNELPLRGVSVTAFLIGGVLFANQAVTSSHPVKIGRSLKTDSADPRLFTAGLLVDQQILLFVAADEPVESVATIEHDGCRHEEHVALAGGEAKLLRIGQRGERSPAETT